MSMGRPVDLMCRNGAATPTVVARSLRARSGVGQPPSSHTHQRPAFPVPSAIPSTWLSSSWALGDGAPFREAAAAAFATLKPGLVGASASYRGIETGAAYLRPVDAAMVACVSTACWGSLAPKRAADTWIGRILGTS
jgi:hypothetical protein